MMDLISTLIASATKAPSGHNTQPWKFFSSGSKITIRPDFSRRLDAVDPDDRELFISLGTATENLVLAARSFEYQAAVRIIARETEPAVEIYLTREFSARVDWLAAIASRQVNRGVFTNQAIPELDQRALQAIALAPGVKAAWITDPASRSALKELVRAGTAYQLADEAFKQELLDWLRLNDREIARHRDGLAYKTLGMPALPGGWCGRLVVKNFLKPRVQNADNDKKLDSAPLWLVLATDRDDLISWINLGRFLQRVLLRATQLGLAHSFFNQPFEVPEIRRRAARLKFIRGCYPSLLVRFGYAPVAPFSLRRLLSEVWPNS